MKELPSVLNFLSAEEENKAEFLKPIIGQELETFCEFDTDVSPKAEVLTIRLMTLGKNSVIPCHLHEKKEKLYVFYGPGILHVGMIRENNFRLFLMKAGTNLIIPPKTWHFVKYFPNKQMPCRILVISSSQSTEDICWEKRTNELITKNT
jgi:quercetin dioxygenase-like cupin family protein